MHLINKISDILEKFSTVVLIAERNNKMSKHKHLGPDPYMIPEDFVPTKGIDIGWIDDAFEDGEFDRTTASFLRFALPRHYWNPNVGFQTILDEYNISWPNPIQKTPELEALFEKYK